jgi:hypothetical protein
VTTLGQQLVTAAGAMGAAEAIAAEHGGVTAEAVRLRGGRTGVAATGSGWALVGDPAEVQAEVGRRAAAGDGG